jgi:hypothetical protein
MAVRIMNFELTVDNERSALAFDMRAAMVDFIRARINETLARAEDADIDKETALRRFSMNYAGAAKGYRLVRSVPSALVSWAAYAEVNKRREGFPAAMPGTVATFNKDSVTMLPGDLLMIKMGGVMFIGQLAGGIPEDLYEVRVHKQDDQRGGKYIATFIVGRPDGDDPIGTPVPVEGENIDA